MLSVCLEEAIGSDFDVSHTVYCYPQLDYDTKVASNVDLGNLPRDQCSNRVGLGLEICKSYVVYQMRNKNNKPIIIVIVES